MYIGGVSVQKDGRCHNGTLNRNPEKRDEQDMRINVAHM